MWMQRRFGPDRLLVGDDGATMLEYGLVMTGIAVVAGVAVAALGGRILPLFTVVF